MDDNFSPKVKDVIAYSKAEALRLGHEYIGTEHVILGLLRKAEGKAIEILNLLDVNLEHLRKRIEVLSPANPTTAKMSTKQDIILTKQADKALIAAAQAGNSSAQYIYASELLKLNKAQPLNDASPAILWLKVAAKHGNTDAMTDLVSLYDRGTFISADHPFIESILNKLHSEGDNNASFTLAKYYINYYKSYSKAWPLLTQAISNDVDGALPYKNLILDSKKVITTEKDIYVASIAQENDLPPVLVKSGARFNVVDELQNGSVFVVEDELGVYGFAEQSLLNAAKVNEDIKPMATLPPVAIETDLIAIKSQSETETSENDVLELQNDIEIDEIIQEKFRLAKR